MIDYFKNFIQRINEKENIIILKSNILQCEEDYKFDLFGRDISDEIKYLYNHYSRFQVSWEENTHNVNGFIEFVPYNKIMDEHIELNEIAENLGSLIEDQDIVINDLKNWYPIFKFPNGDAFCYEKRNGKVVFFEHEVFDTGVNLHGLVIADSVDHLMKNWSRLLFIDIYDWYEGVDEHGINLNRPIYEKILQII